MWTKLLCCVFASFVIIFASRSCWNSHKQQKHEADPDCIYVCAGESAKELGVSVSYFFDDINISERYEQKGNHNLQARQIDKVEMNTNNVSTFDQDNDIECSKAILAERIKSLESLLAEKNVRIDELKERIKKLKAI